MRPQQRFSKAAFGSTFAPEPPLTSALNAGRRQVRRALRANVTIYQAFQRLRGRQYTREEILQIHRREFGGPLDARMPRVKLLARVSRGAAQFDADTCIISCGLDWQYKDLRSVWSLKQSFGFRYCAVIFDLIPLAFPHFVTPGYNTFLGDYFGELVWLADCSMCISNASHTDWMDFCKSFGVERSSAFVFPLGCDLPSLSTHSLPHSLQGKRFALFVSTIEPRKNHRVLYDAWDRCIRSGTVDPQRDRLAFVGRAGWAVDDLMREIAVNPATRDTIVILDQVTDELLARLYRECAFVLFPSFCEGYGIPVAEALGYSKPCIISDVESLCEIGGDLVMRIDPKDTIRWADAIAHYMSSPDELDDWHRRIQDPAPAGNVGRCSVSLFQHRQRHRVVIKRALGFGTFPAVTPVHGGQRRAAAFRDFYRQLGIEYVYTCIYDSIPYAPPLVGQHDIPLIVPDSDEGPISLIGDILSGRQGATHEASFHHFLKLVERLNPDVLQLEQPFMWPLAKRLRETVGKLPLIYSSYNVEAPLKEAILLGDGVAADVRRRICGSIEAMEAEICREAALVVCVTASERNHYLGYCAPEKVVVVPNGVRSAARRHSGVPALPRELWRLAIRVRGRQCVSAEYRGLVRLCFQGWRFHGAAGQEHRRVRWRLPGCVSPSCVPAIPCSEFGEGRVLSRD